MKIIIAAGGTGGHIYPGIALAEELKLKDPQNEILFIGSKDGLEKSLVQFPIKLINARGLLRKISWKAISAPFITLKGFFQAQRILKDFKPDWIVSMGGYVSLPVVAAARISGFPILLHEENVLPGITNRFCSRFARVITLSFKESLRYMKGTVTGNPVRRNIIESSPNKKGPFTVLIVGGSQGARSINQKVVSMLDEFLNTDITIIHISGKRDYAALQKKKYPFYTIVPYMYNIEEGLKAANLVVSRAGATAISEILVAGKPSILIPFPYSSEGHQELNAKVIESRGGAIILHDDKLDELPALIKELADNKTKLNKMEEAARSLARPDAAGRIVELLYEKT